MAAAAPYKLSPKARARVERLGVLKMQMDALKSEYDELRNIHGEYLKRVGHSVTEKVGPVNAFLRIIKSWKYSETVERLRAKLKAAEAKEQHTGIATFTESSAVVVTLSAKVLAVEVGEKLNLEIFEKVIHEAAIAEPAQV